MRTHITETSTFGQTGETSVPKEICNHAGIEHGYEFRWWYDGDSVEIYCPDARTLVNGVIGDMDRVVAFGKTKVWRKHMNVGRVDIPNMVADEMDLSFGDILRWYYNGSTIEMTKTGRHASDP